MARHEAVDMGGGYVVHFVYVAPTSFTTRVTHNGAYVGERENCHSHLLAARWARRQVRRHRRALRILAPKDPIDTVRS